jgi:outer membrane receptor protein involved in Fe transport
MTYSTQRYDGGNAVAVEAIQDSARNVGSIYGYDEWTVSPRLVLGYGTGYARYDYLGGPGVWSPRLSLTVPFDGFRIRALASQQALVPGAEEFAPSITGIWLPPERTFSSLAADGRFTAERTRHVELAVERDLAPGVTLAVRGFEQHTTDQLVEIFDAVPGVGDAAVGHYFVATAGDVNARGWGVGLTHELAANVRSSVHYTAAIARWSGASDVPLVPGVGMLPHGSERMHDIQTSVAAMIPQTATRVFAAYRLNTAFRNDDLDWAMGAGAAARFSVRVNQALPFMSFSNADWEALVDVRNAFREALAEASIYDEALAIKAPKRIVGGLMVKF